MTFARSFFNKDGQEVAGIWYDGELRKWRVSTIPIEGFATEEEAVKCFHMRCDPEKGHPPKCDKLLGKSQPITFRAHS